MTADARVELIRKFKNDFAFYAGRCLKILDKRGKLVNFQLNTAQRYAHERLEQQLHEKGWIRALILKGRQQGLSTYTEGRFFGKTALNKGRKAMVMTHLQSSTDSVFAMVKRYFENYPKAMRPSVGKADAKELIFNKLDSGYKVATAGSKSVGRGITAQHFHGSEVAFWPNAEEHVAGVMQAIALLDGTEIILESTANGVGNVFYQLWQDAEAGTSDFIAIFVPWYWQEEYTRDVPDGFEASLSQDERTYQGMYGLTLGQMAWRRAKINTEFRGDELLFQQEYPATAAEAFISTDNNAYIKAVAVLAARKNTDLEAAEQAPLIIGVDPARGGDRTGFAIRRGRVVLDCWGIQNDETMHVVGLVGKMIADFQPDKVFIDMVGIGVGVVDRLHELGHRNVVVPVWAGASAEENDIYLNKRSEMWGRMNEWFQEGPVSVPDSDELQADITNVGYTYDSSSRLQMESKEKMKKDKKRSPDLADALALTFSYSVAPRGANKTQISRTRTRGRNSWRG